MRYAVKLPLAGEFTRTVADQALRNAAITDGDDDTGMVDGEGVVGNPLTDEDPASGRKSGGSEKMRKTFGRTGELESRVSNKAITRALRRLDPCSSH